MRTPRPLPPALHDAPFSVAAAHELDVSPRRLRASDLHRPFHGVRSTEAPDSVLDLARALSTRMRPDQFFSHATAAQILGIPLPRSQSSAVPLHVAAIAPRFVSARAGVIRHHIARADPVDRGGVRVCDPVTTWFQLAETLRLPDLVAAGDYLVTGSDLFQRSPPLVSHSELKEGMRRYARRRGVGTARRALALVRQGPLSRPESLLRVAIVMAGLPEPCINWPILLATGRTVYADLAYPEHRFALEYEGDYHRTDTRTFRKDLLRRELLLDVGWEMMRITADDLHDEHRLVSRVRGRLNRRRPV